ncbi:MAG TPA: PilZ domain-containing protein [Burkholderiaceae bacterium]
MTTERRHFARVSFASGAELITTQVHLHVQVLDLSLKGALLQLPPDAGVASGAPCLLKLTLDQGETQISMAGELAHVVDGKAGMICRSIDIESITHLRRLIAMNTGDPTLLQRELAALVSV